MWNTPVLDIEDVEYSECEIREYIATHYNDTSPRFSDDPLLLTDNMTFEVEI